MAEALEVRERLVQPRGGVEAQACDLVLGGRVHAHDARAVRLHRRGHHHVLAEHDERVDAPLLERIHRAVERGDLLVGAQQHQVVALGARGAVDASGDGGEEAVAQEALAVAGVHHPEHHAAPGLERARVVVRLVAQRARGDDNPADAGLAEFELLSTAIEREAGCGDADASPGGDVLEDDGHELLASPCTCRGQAPWRGQAHFPAGAVAAAGAPGAMASAGSGWPVGVKVMAAALTQ